MALFDPSLHHRIVIEITGNQLNQLQANMVSQYEKYQHYRSSLYVHANMVYYENNVEKKRIDDIGLRTHGNIFSRGLPNYNGSQVNFLHYRLSFDETFDMDPNSVEYSQRKKRDFYGLENLVIKWNRTSAGTPFEVDPYMTEAYGYLLYEKAGIPSPKATLAHVQLRIDGNLLNLGLMTLIEPIDDEFIQKRFLTDIPEGNLYKALWQNGPANLDNIEDWMIGEKNEEANYFPAYDKKTNETTNSGQDIKNLIQNLKSKDGSTLKTYLDATMDLDQYMRFMAMNYLLGNPDDIRYNSNNYYMYFATGDNPKLHFMPVDLDKILGILDWNPNGNYMEYLLPLNNFVSGSSQNLLVNKTILSSLADFRNPYLNYVREFTNSLMNFQDFQAYYNIAYNLYQNDWQTTNSFQSPKPMGIPTIVSHYYCTMNYKVKNNKIPTENDC